MGGSGEHDTSLVNLSFLLERADSIRTWMLEDRIPSNRWHPWTALDVYSFHVVLRATYDYLARCYEAVALKRGEAPCDSFKKLQSWANEESKRANRIFGEELADLIRSAVHFGPARGLRDLLVHQDGSTIIYSRPSDGILFDVTKLGDPFKSLVADRMFASAYDLPDFRLYAASLVVCTLVLLDSTAEVLFGREQRAVAEGGFTSTKALASWVNDYVARISTVGAEPSA